MMKGRVYCYIKRNAYIINNLLLSFSSVCMLLALSPLLNMVFGNQPTSWHIYNVVLFVLSILLFISLFVLAHVIAPDMLLKKNVKKKP